MTKIDEMISYCERENVYYFCDLVKYASENRKDWFRVVSTENGSRIIELWEGEATTTHPPRVPSSKFQV